MHKQILSKQAFENKITIILENARVRKGNSCPMVDYIYRTTNL